MNVTDWFLAGIGLGAILFATGYAMLWLAVRIAFGCGVISDWVKRAIRDSG
jgi:hypothetical protein